MRVKKYKEGGTGPGGRKKSYAMGASGIAPSTSKSRRDQEMRASARKKQLEAEIAKAKGTPRAKALVAEYRRLTGQK